jgi:uncharacterized protein (DUF427 family)
MKIIIEEVKFKDSGTVFHCSSKGTSSAIGRTPEESFKNWKDIKWMYDNPEKVAEIGNEMVRDYFSAKGINCDNIQEAGSGVWMRKDV